MRSFTCPRCHVASAQPKEHLRIETVEPGSGHRSKKVFCDHYKRSETTPEAFEINRNMRDCFKDADDCSYCMQRIHGVDDSMYCPFSHYDNDAANFYYETPVGRGSGSSAPEGVGRRLNLTYWTCPNCMSRIEISRRES